MADLTFFFDRSVGVHDVPQVFRDAGHRVVLMRDHYPEGGDQAVGDDEWIADAAARGWIAVTKDAAIVRAHTAALVTSGIQVFSLPNANMTGPQMAERVRLHMGAIERQALLPGPFVTGIYAQGLQRRWPPPEA